MIDLKVTLYEILKKLENGGGGGSTDIEWTIVPLMDEYNIHQKSILRIPNNVETFADLVEATAEDINIGLNIDNNDVIYNNYYLYGYSISGLFMHLGPDTRIEDINTAVIKCYKEHPEM